MEIIAGIVWIALGIFVIIKKGAAGIGGPPLVGTICALWVFVSFYICGKSLEYTDGSPICFFVAFMSCASALAFISSDKKQDLAHGLLCIIGFIFAPGCLIIDMLKHATDHVINPWSLFAYVFFAFFDAYHFTKHEKQESEDLQKLISEQESKKWDIPAVDLRPTRIWVDGRFIDAEQETEEIQEEIPQEDSNSNTIAESCEDYSSLYHMSYPYNGSSFQEGGEP